MEGNGFEISVEDGEEIHLCRYRVSRNVLRLTTNCDTALHLHDLLLVWFKRAFQLLRGWRVGKDRDSGGLGRVSPSIEQGGRSVRSDEGRSVQ